MPSAVVDTINRYRALLLDAEQAQTAEAARRWLQIEQALQAQVDALAYELANTTTPTFGQLSRSARYRALRQQLNAELAKYVNETEDVITRGQRDMITRAISHSATAINTVATEAQIIVPFNQLPTEAVANMIGLAGDGSPLRAVLNEATRGAGDALGQQLVNGIALGKNPVTVARMAMRLGLGQSFTRLQNIARTEQLRVYRETTLRSYQASGSVIAYRRLSARDNRTCFIAGTMIATPDGEKPIESIVAGDTVSTHFGPRRVTAVMARPYTGDLITYAYGNKATTCTPNHAIWVGRDGEYKWLPAGMLCVGDKLVLAEQVNQQLAGNGGDGSGSFPSKMDRLISLPGEKGIAPTFLGGVLVPVPTIGLESDIVGQNEVNGVSPYWDLFSIKNAKFQEGIFAGNFERCIASMRPVAVGSAEIVAINDCTRATAKFFAAVSASNQVRWAAAFLRTVVSVQSFFCPKDFATSLAGSIFCFLGPTLHRASSIPFFVGCSHGEVVIANGACFGDSGAGGVVAFPRAIQAINRDRFLELLSALSAGMRFPVAMKNVTAFPAATHGSFGGDRYRILQIRRRFLERLPANRAGQFHAFIASNANSFVSAFHRAIRMIGAFESGRMTLGGSAADGALNGYHDPIISRVRRHSQPQTTVYDVEVEDAHTYFANGVLVHNCPACLFADGRIYRLDEGFDEHPQGRCTLIPVLSGVPPAQFENGQQWFRSQPTATQRQMLGKGRFEAWQDGRASLDDLVSRDWNDTWGGALRTTNVRDLNP